MQLSRRSLIHGAALTAAALPARASAHLPGDLPLTPTQEMGPFYPIVRDLESHADFTTGGGSPGGPALSLTGRVLTAAGRPVASAMVLVWQADGGGHYAHPRDPTGGADLPFRGHALLRTRRDGSFSLRSVRPGAYPDMPGTLRTPHIHFEVIGEEDRLTTQMYFPGEPLNETDRLLRTLRQQGGDPSTLIARAAGMDGEVRRYEWDIVVPKG